MILVLSLFPGADLLGRGFEAEGFCVVRGPDILWGQDIRGWRPAPHKFDGIIGGSPCQDFSKARRCAPSGEGVELLNHFARCVTEAEPEWFLLENVPGVPDIVVSGYSVQRLNITAAECGAAQSRLRCFQFGSRTGKVIVPRRLVTMPAESQPCCMATEGKRANRRSFADFCELQGLPRTFAMPGMSRGAQYKAVGNGVPVMMARVMARAVVNARHVTESRLCICHCGREVKAGQTMATPACRKRMQRRRDAAGVTVPGPDTAQLSLMP